MSTLSISLVFGIFGSEAQFIEMVEGRDFEISIKTRLWASE